MLTFGLIVVCIILYVAGILPVLAYRIMSGTILRTGKFVDRQVRPAMKRFVNLTDNIMHKKLASKMDRAYKDTAET